MPLNKEMKEIIEYLNKRNDYAIFAGFASFAHVGVVPSPDIDIYTKSKEARDEITKDFKTKGWKIELKEKKWERMVYIRKERNHTR